MKTIPIALATHYALAGTTLCTCLKIEPRNADPVGITTVDIPVTIEGLTYRPGLSVSDMVATANLAVDNLDASVLKINGILTDEDLAAGFLDQANYTLFECNFDAPGDGVNVLKRGTTGQAQINQGIWVVEFRSLKQALQQPLGAVTSRTCRAHLGDNDCKVDLAPFTFACAVTSVVSQQQFTDSDRTEVDEWFVEGEVTFITGANAGYGQKVKVFEDGEFFLSIPMPFAVEIGDTFSAIAGCQKRHERTLANPDGASDCLDKFDNVLNFQGEPHLSGADGLTSIPTVEGE